MPKLHVEALIFCAVWIALAIAAAVLSDWWVGAVLSAGLLLVLMPTSALILSRTGDFRLERQVRWALLAAAAVGLLIYLKS